MYTTALEARRLTLLEWAFLYLCIIFAFLSITFGCYFTFMTRYGNHRVFLERIEQMETDSSDDESEDGSDTSTTYAGLTMASSAAQLLDIALKSSQTKTSTSVGRPTLISTDSTSSAVTHSLATLISADSTSSAVTPSTATN